MMDKDAYIKKLEKRIHNQRAQLRWWDEMFDIHVQGHKRRAILENGRKVREWALRSARRKVG